MKQRYFSNDTIYHLYNRGIEKRNIAMDQGDRIRFVHSLYEFNSTDAIQVSRSQTYDTSMNRRRNTLVDIYAWCLMKNHYHLMVKQKIEGGITEFMRRLGTGYTMFFNAKHGRSGHLFQGKFKSVELTTESHFSYMPHYIHLNPLDYFAPEWRSRNISNTREAMKYLEEYRWSSFMDYINVRNFPSVINPNFLNGIFGNNILGETSETLKAFSAEDIAGYTLE